MEYTVRIYLTTFVDVKVQAENEQQAIDYAEHNSDCWFADNQIENNAELWEGETQVVEC